MAGRVFRIEEVIPRGATPPRDGAQVFEWTAKHRNIPLRPWSFEVTQRTVRTDYPGADDPTEQVLGPNFEPFTLQGRWDDRYNPQGSLDPNSADDRGLIESGSVEAIRGRLGGYAVQEQARFEKMVRRGNQVRITFEEITILGIITRVRFDYRRSWDIGYEFSVSPHHRAPAGFFSISRSPRTALNSRQLRAEVEATVAEIVAFHDDSPIERLTGTIYTDVDELVDELADGIANIELAITQRQLVSETERDQGLLRLSSLFFSTATTAAAIIEVLRGLDSSEALDFEAGISVLEFDVWSRGIMEYARRTVIAAQRASSEILQRAQPNAMRLYQPQKGESLYSISNRFYQTPHNWRAIARRNNLSSFILTGEELLIIPEVTGR